jgi:hypothetical protein
MRNGILLFWSISLVAGVAALLACRLRAFLAVFILPLSVAVPFALSSAVGSGGPRFPGLGTSDVVCACLLVLALNLLGMHLGGYRFTFFTLYEGRGPSPTERSPDERS